MTAPEERLRLAASEGNVLRVQTFIAQGLSPQAADERGITPLFLAARKGHRDVVALLLEQGASSTAARQDGVTPIFTAVQEGHRDVVALMLRHDPEVTRQTGFGGVTLLHVAAYRGDQKMVALLLEHGADKQARMSTGERPVDMARQRGHSALVPLLEP